MQSDDDNTALIKACRRGYVKRVRELLEKGTKLNVDYTDKVPIVIICSTVLTVCRGLHIIIVLFCCTGTGWPISSLACK